MLVLRNCVSRAESDLAADVTDRRSARTVSNRAGELVDVGEMLRCPSCDAFLQTLDLPCPVCASLGEDLHAASNLVHEYSKTFETRGRSGRIPTRL